MSTSYQCPVCRVEYEDPPTQADPCTTEGCPVGEGSRDPITRRDSQEEVHDLYLFNYANGRR